MRLATCIACGCIVDACNADGVMARRGTEAYRNVVIEACVAYGAYDQDSSTCVSIGKPHSASALAYYGGNEPVEPDTVLRANTSLERYVRRNYLRNR